MRSAELPMADCELRTANWPCHRKGVKNAKKNSTRINADQILG